MLLELNNLSDVYDGDNRAITKLMVDQESLGASIGNCQLWTMLLLQRGGHGDCNWTVRRVLGAQPTKPRNIQGQLVAQ